MNLPDLPLNISTVSLDVFDTLLLRNAQPEPERFLQISTLQAKHLHRLGVHIPAKELYWARRFAHENDYRTAPLVAGERDGQVLRMYQHILGVLGAPRTLAADLLTWEIAWEAQHLKPNRALLRWCHAQRSLRPEVSWIVVSDMYLPGGAIEQLLTRHLHTLPLKQMFVSGDIGCSKYGGGLFRYVTNTLDLTPASVLHIGDHPISDVQQPRAHGMEAWHLPRSWPVRTLRSIRRRISPAQRTLIP